MKAIPLPSGRLVNYIRWMRRLAEDTSPEAERVLIDLWRQATPARKFALVLDTTRTLQEFMLTGLRERYPHDTPARLRYRFSELWLGPELTRRAYGEMPDDTIGLQL